jgi:hypothetical protein
VLEQEKKKKFNRSGSGANRSVFSTITSTEEVNNKVVVKKKATFDMDPEIHSELKTYAARRGFPMITVVEKAIKKYIKDNP